MNYSYFIVFIKPPCVGQAVVAHTFNPSTREAQADLCEFEANLVYRASSRTSSKTTEKPWLKKTNKQKQTKQQKLCIIFKNIYC